ncbi:hypothetical protein EPJ69_07850 [Brachyspira aalborgi]|uniref:Lipoprotein n=1 Tax=Brachyspira aalborgi TaxID=29522 RepID=A0A5C8E1G8_9SPIR|nr:hypothetical protein [Brachyspira aalborgi]TXJ31540.1 hypothetical protein EPJ69_07850 [Brachyspira aalborgi]CCY78276.1 unknown [Brachyspira sp. CAG:700]
MTKTKQNKRLLYLVALAIMIALMSIACKNKATAPLASFSEDSSEEVVKPEGPTTPETPEEPKPTVGTFSKYAGSYISSNKYNDGKGEGFYKHKAVLDGDNVTLYKVYVDSGREAKWEVGKSVNGTFTVKGSWMTFSLDISGNQIILNLPYGQKVYVNKI